MAILKSNKRITLFTLTEREELYGFPQFTEQEQQNYFSLNAHTQQLANTFKQLEDKIYCLLCLGYFRAKHCLIRFTYQQAKYDLTYIIQTHFSGTIFLKQFPAKAQQIRIQNKVLQHAGFVRWNSLLKKELLTFLASAIKRYPKANTLAKMLLNYFSQQRIALPAYSTLQRLITEAIAHEQKHLHRTYQQWVTHSQQAIIAKLLQQEEVLHQITMIKKEIKDFSYTELRKEIHKHECLKPIFQIAKQILPHFSLPSETLRYYGSLAHYYSVYKLKRMQSEQSHLYLLCYSFLRYQKVNDNLMEFFRRYVNNFHEEAKANSKEHIYQQHVTIDKIFLKVSDILQLFLENSLDYVDKQNAYQILPKEQIPIAQRYLKGQFLPELFFYWSYIDTLAIKIQRYLRPLFLSIDFSFTEKSQLAVIIAQFKSALIQPVIDKNELFDDVLADTCS